MTGTQVGILLSIALWLLVGALGFYFKYGAS